MDCLICYEAITAATGKVELSCSHSFHFSCLTSWFATQNSNDHKQSCPSCRHESNEHEKIKLTITDKPKDDELELLPFKLGGMHYLRLGIQEGDNYIWHEHGDLWINSHKSAPAATASLARARSAVAEAATQYRSATSALRNATVRGVYIGTIDTDGKIDTNADEPILE